MSPRLNTHSPVVSFQRFFDSTYSNSNRSMTFEYMLCYLPRTCGYMFKKTLDKKITSADCVKPIAWLFALANKLGGNLEQSLVSRYPGVCPHCLQAPCSCLRTGKKPPVYMPAYKVLEELQAKANVVLNGGAVLSFGYFIENSRRIYPNNEIIWTFAGPSFHFAKIQEEIAEIHEAYSGYCRKTKPLEAVMAEIADVFAWVLAAWNISIDGQSPADEIISAYLSGCPVCHSQECSCKPYHSRAVSLIDKEVLIEIKNELASIRENGGITSSKFDDLMQSLDVAASSLDDPISHLAIEQTRETLQQLASGLIVGSAQNVRLSAKRLLERIDPFR